MLSTYGGDGSYIYISKLNLLTMTIITNCWEIINEVGQICARGLSNNLTKEKVKFQNLECFLTLLNLLMKMKSMCLYVP